MFNKINKITTYKNCLHSLNSIDIKSVIQTQKLINNNLTKSIQAPITTLSVNNLNNIITSFHSNSSLSTTPCINNKIVNQEDENFTKQYHTLNNNSKLFNISNIPFEPSVEIYQSNKQLNKMVEKTSICKEAPKEINLNQDLKKNISKDITLIDIHNESDGETVVTYDSDEDKLDDIGNSISDIEEKDLSTYDEIDILGDSHFDDKTNMEDTLYSVKNKLNNADKSDSEATIVTSPRISDDSSNTSEEMINDGINKFKILYACSNEPKSYRIGGLPAICKKDCGEDAYFELDQNNFMVFGIADGVGGWNKSGVDPSLFAWDLMNSCKDVTEDLDDWPDPKTILIDGYDMVVRKKEVKAGSSTACILTLDKISGIIYSTNLGDSGFTVIRDNKVVFRTQEQQHYFNAPYQLSIIPDTSIAYLQNTPHDAEDEQFCAEEGDVIILGTDGLWDNMYNEDIIKVLKDDVNNIKESKAEVKTREQYLAWEKETNEVLSGLSYQLTQQAKKYSQDWYRESPFSKKFNSAGQYYSGGKIDDITIILMYVTYDRFSNLKPKNLIK